MSDERRGPLHGRVLVVEDEEIVRQLLTGLLREEGYSVDAVPTGEEALRALDRELYDLVLLDLNLPGMHGMNVLSAAPALQTDAEFIVMTAFGSVDNAVEAMKLGAFDYVNKPFRTEELLLTMERALHQTALRREVAQLRRHAADGVRTRIVGRSPAMERMFDLVERVAPTRATVLITGETGTGKELVARAIHELSDRARKPFVPINCSALPETLLESELFGHTKGSFTGAIANKRGLFEEASGGTLFLDEISTIPSVHPGQAAPRAAGAEAAPHRRVAARPRGFPPPRRHQPRPRRGGPRRPLPRGPVLPPQRVPVRVPALRERQGDIPLLANYFRLRFAHENGVHAPEIAADAMKRLMEYAWPGNVRELENYIERAVIMYAGARSIPFEPPGSEADRPEQNLIAAATQEHWSMARLEKEYILEVLQQTSGHRGRAADILGIDRRTLYRKLKQYAREGNGVAPPTDE
jgi:DNA-binding NtrC family response regulator